MSLKAEPNVVPLCDVLLVLLIIFMVITPAIQKGIDVKLPETVSDAAAAPADVIVMTVHKDYRVDINRSYLDFDQVKNRLEEIYAPRQEKIIFIRAEAKVPFSKVVELIDIAKAVGIDVLGLVPEYFEDQQLP
jgi:biopolymer transport protein ExbD